MHRRYFALAVLLFAIVGIFLRDAYYLHVLILCFIWSIVVAAWDLVIGYAGIYNFAQLVFFAVGAYLAGMLPITYGVNPDIAFLLCGIGGGATGLLVGLPCLRLRGEYIALFTFAVSLALPTVLREGRGFGTGGATGIMGIPAPGIGGYTLGYTNDVGWYFFSLILGAACVYFVYYVVTDSKLGRAVTALRDSDQLGRALGVNPVKYKLMIFTLSAFITGLAGALYGVYVSDITPKVMGTEFFLMVMVMLAVGGMGRYPGAVLGAFIVTIGNELLRPTGQFRLLALGIVVVMTLLIMPEGVVGVRTAKRSRSQRDNEGIQSAVADVQTSSALDDSKCATHSFFRDMRRRP